MLARTTLIIVLLAVTALTSCKPPKQDETLDLPKVTTETPPEKVAAIFVSMLEQYLKYEHTDQQSAKAIMQAAQNLVAEEPIMKRISALGINPSKLKPDTLAEKKKEISKDLVNSWAGVINFYAGHIEYPKTTTSPATAAAKKTTTIITMHAERKDTDTKPVKIIIGCQKQDTWKIKFVSLKPQ